MKLTSTFLAPAAVALLLVACSRGDLGGSQGAAGAASGTAGACFDLGRICPPYSDLHGDAASGCAAGVFPCWEAEKPCGPYRLFDGNPDRENRSRCVYDSGGTLISAMAYGSNGPEYCQIQRSCGSSAGTCGDQVMGAASFHIGLDVTCETADGGVGDGGTGGASGGCIRPDQLCPARYMPVAPGESC